MSELELQQNFMPPYSKEFISVFHLDWLIIRFFCVHLLPETMKTPK